MKEVVAQLRFLRTSPRKMRLVVDTVRGRDVVRAQNSLSMLNKKAAKYLLKLLNSAVANAKHNFNIPVDTLRIKKITVDGGPMLKRWMPKAHGRATPVRERTSHIYLALEEFEKKTKKSEARNQKSETNSKSK
ncbi:MAG: 50S ribosomal protein L22 [Candidatus Magasanikbacteria bacterium RIFCSPHIGHO2_01_FULL_47_8]|uniref:Large ribosomal subunit protein uL22 n=1 Tax=Candidatus Magasanikbacteria bacterium RIFCSPHIGHO2_01_FULL_47_8 TaxID=1798673 RepID=A0A1F6MCQ9_9BACT|nr:MAG: 50S ribosomal protein L22 [Candidatus Magasanikbacteria bacterium RIFCSPHIGHO2_01_FULL_47_8]